MPQVSFSSSEFQQPNFVAEPLTSMCLVPAGAKLVSTEFPFVGEFEIHVGSAGAAVGATTVPTDALPVALPIGTVLDFGAVAALTVTVNGTPADNATTLVVQAIARPIPAGTYLSFGSGKFAVVTATANTGATSLTTLAMPTGTKPLDTNTATLPATRKVATLTAAAAKGATSLTIAALAFPLYDADVAYYSDSGKLVKAVKPGTLVGRTFTERGNGVGFGLANAASGGDDEIYLLAFGVTDAMVNADCTLLRHNTQIYENKLPGWSGMSSDEKAKVRSLYECILSA